MRPELDVAENTTSWALWELTGVELLANHQLPFRQHISTVFFAPYQLKCLLEDRNEGLEPLTE